MAFLRSLFKILVIQAQNNLADERTEFLINDRLSFMRFLGLGLEDQVPDARTIWLFREKLTKAGAIETLFARFDGAVREAGYIPMSGQIVDASLVSAPKQKVRRTCPCRARLRRAEGPHGSVHPYHRSGPGQDQDRPGQPGLQHEAADLATTQRDRLGGARTQGAG